MNKILFSTITFFFCLCSSIAQQIEVLPQTGHAKQVTGLSMNPTGMYFATMGADRTIKIWDVETGAIIKNFEGHNKAIQSASFSLEGNYLISSGADSKVLVWKVNSDAATINKNRDFSAQSVTNYRQAQFLKNAAKNEQTLGNFHQICHGPGGAIISSDLSPDKEKKIGVKSDGTVMFWESSNNVQGQANSGMNDCLKIFFTADNKKYVVISKSQIGVWGTKEGSKGKINDLSNLGTRVKVSRDRKLVAILEETGNISVYSTKSLKRTHELTGINADQLSFGKSDEEIVYVSQKEIYKYSLSSGSKQKVATCTKRWSHFDYSSKHDYAVGVINENEIIVRSLENGSVVYRRPSVNIDYESVMISPNWNYLINTSTEEGYVQVSDIIHAKTELVLPGQIANAKSIALSNDYLAIPLQSDQIAIYELRNLNRTQTIDVVSGHYAGAAFNPHRDELITWESTGIIEIYNITSGENVFHVDLQQLIHQVKLVDGNNCIATYVDGGAEMFSYTDYNQPHRTFDCAPTSALGVSADGSFIVLESENDGIIIHNLLTDQEIGTFSKMTSAAISQIAFSPDSKYISATYANNQLRIWEAETGNLLSSRTKGRRLCKPFTPTFSPDGKLIFLVNHDHNIIMWSWDTRPIPGSMNHKRPEEFEHRMVLSPDGTVLQTDDNYYIIAGNAHQLLKFRKGREVYSFDQFDLHYNRPDKVLEKLGLGSEDLKAIYKRAYNKRLERLGFKNSRINRSYHLPKLIVSNKKEIPFETNEKFITLNIKCNDSKEYIKLVKVYVNGVPINSERGYKVEGRKREIEKDIKIELSNGDNLIEVSCINDATAESYKTTIETRYTGPAEKPKLYILSIGTSKYKDEAQNLYYASKDARDFVKAMGATSEHFSDVVINILEDEQVTKGSIKLQLDKLKTVGVDDQVYIFIAGHGQLDENFDYYIATHTMDFNNPAQYGYSYNDLERSLEFIPSRHKVLFIDACHSGEIDKSGVTMVKYERKEEGKVQFRAADDNQVIQINNTLDMMKELFTDLENSSGTTIISSAGGAEFAVEGDQWSNGVFTYCLIEGVTNGNADKNQDGKIMLSEVFDYLTHRVPKITRGNQQPTSRAMNMKNDIRVK